MVMISIRPFTESDCDRLVEILKINGQKESI